MTRSRQTTPLRPMQIRAANDRCTVTLFPGANYFTDTDTMIRRRAMANRLRVARQWMWLNNIREYRYVLRFGK